MIVNSTSKLIKCFKNSNNNYNITLFKYKINNDINYNNNNNRSFYNKRLFTTLNNSNNNNNNNNNSNNENKDENKDENESNKLSKEEEELIKEKVDQIVKEIEEQQQKDEDSQLIKNQDYSKLTELEKEEKRKRIYDEINKLDEEEDKPDPLEKDEDEEDEDEADDFDYPSGTEKTPLIFEDDKKNQTHKVVSDSLELIAIDGKLGYMDGIRSIFSFYGFYSSYMPTRNIPLLNPFIHFCKDQINYLFKKNPFFIIMIHRVNSKLLISELHNRIQDTPIPSFIDKNEFLEESSKAIKQIYKLAENEKSLELQKISCIPATPNLLSLRDVYYSVGKVDGLDFNVDDISIDNFELEPIDCKAYINDFNESYLKMESTYRVISNRYSDQCKDYPVIIRANWTTPFQDKTEEEIDWKIFGIEFSTDYDPK